MKVLLCSPEYFDVRYEINPWMDVNNNSQSHLAMSQWRHLINALTSAGAEIAHILPHPDLPDMVFTANAGLVKDKQVILSNFKHEERCGEQYLFERWFLQRRYETILLPDDIYFEGAGDALFFRDLLFMGHGFRTDSKSHGLIAEILDVDYISLELRNPNFYHLDTCLFVSDDHICFYEKAFTPESFSKGMAKLIQYIAKENLSVRISSVSEEQAHNFICNSVCVRGHVITPAVNCSDIFSSAIKCDMSEFMKSGGAVKCLTLTL